MIAFNREASRDEIAGAWILATDYGCVRVTDSTVALMDIHFPGWRDPKSIKGRTRVAKHARQRAQSGADLLAASINNLSALAFLTESELVSI